jgi:hypothetical protein
MKTILTLALMSVMLVSCVDVYDGPRYDYRDRMIGNYEVEEYSDTYDEYVYYNMYVSKDRSSADGVYFQDFYASGLGVYAYINGDRITIPFQVSEGYEVEGHGTYYRGELQLHYTVRDRYSNAPTDYCDTVAYPE